MTTYVLLCPGPRAKSSFIIQNGDLSIREAGEGAFEERLAHELSCVVSTSRNSNNLNLSLINLEIQTIINDVMDVGTSDLPKSRGRAAPSDIYSCKFVNKLHTAVILCPFAFQNWDQLLSYYTSETRILHLTGKNVGAVRFSDEIEISKAIY